MFVLRQVSRAGALIAGPGVYICDECVDLCNEILDEELLDSNTPQQAARQKLLKSARNALQIFRWIKFSSPRDQKHLDEHVIGQDEAKFYRLQFTTITSDWA